MYNFIVRVLATVTHIYVHTYVQCVYGLGTPCCVYVCYNSLYHAHCPYITLCVTVGDRDCLNGGVCQGGMCRCPFGFRGEYCEDSEFVIHTHTQP